MGRRGRNTQRGSKRHEETWRGMERHGDVEWVVPHPPEVDKNQEGYLRSK